MSKLILVLLLCTILIVIFIVYRHAKKTSQIQYDFLHTDNARERRRLLDAEIRRQRANISTMPHTARFVNDLLNIRYHIDFFDDYADDVRQDIIYIEMATPIINRNVSHTNALIARNNTDNIAEAADVYFDNMENHKTDTQNVHDSAITQETRNAIARLRHESSGGDPQTSINAARSFARRTKSPEQIRLIDSVLALISEGKYVVSYEEHEHNIFHLVWSRGSNRKKDPIHENILIALLDCYENANIVCINGRITRVLSALQLCDPLVGKLVSIQDYKNDIFRDCSSLVARSIASLDGELHDYYTGKVTTLTDTALNDAFIRDVKSKMDTIVDSYDIPDHQRDAIRVECYAAIE